MRPAGRPELPGRPRLPPGHHRAGHRTQQPRPARTATRTYTRTVDITPGKTSRADVYGWARDYAVTETARTHGLGDQLTTAVLYFDLASDQLW